MCSSVESYLHNTSDVAMCFSGFYKQNPIKNRTETYKIINND